MEKKAIVTVNRLELLQAMNNARHAIAPGALQMFSYYLFEVSRHNLTVTACNGDMSIRHQIDATLEGEPGRFTLYGQQLTKALRLLEDENVTITTYDYQFSVNHSHGSFLLPFGINEGEYAIYPKEPENYDHSVCVEAPGLKQWIGSVAFATADDALRPVMNGVYFDFEETYFTVVASDGHILARHTTKVENLFHGGYIFPDAVIRVLLKVLPKAGWVDMDFSERCVRISISYGDDNPDVPLTIIFKPTEGRFPNWRSVIPSHNDYRFSVDTKTLLKSLMRVDLFGNDSSRLVQFRFAEDAKKVEISGKDIDFNSEASETIEVVEDKTGNISHFTDKWGYRNPALQQVLKRIGTKDVVFSIQDPSRATIIQPVRTDGRDSRLLLLIMPMLTSD